MLKPFFCALICLIFAGLPARAGAGDDILGLWVTAEDKARVEIFKRNDKYYGKILSLKEPNWPADDDKGMAGQPKNDRNNPDPRLRNRKILGLGIMNEFVYSGKNRWVGGTIYDPESGRTYKGKMTLAATNRLEMRGFVGISLLGRTTVWTRAER
ncbi:MAG TPA: DUF2147 domain-containing protein [Verrucomicrobiae bacterium]|nr:DUF2147 domain-containing protein [Verrucomicrobiae bacterium]